MDLGIRGKVAIVTGGSAGLGEAIADHLAAEGCRIALVARSPERLHAAAARLRSRHGVDVLAIAADITQTADVLRLRDAVEQTFGGPDILVVNTGRPPAKMAAVLDETDDARWEQAYNTQLRGAIVVSRSIVPALVARGWGRVIAVTSASVKQPMSKHALSTVYRAGVTALLKHLANEVAAQGVTVNMVCPASIATPALVSSYDVSERVAEVPMRRLGRPEELAATVAFLASVPAGFITGASIQVDGGMVAALV